MLLSALAVELLFTTIPTRGFLERVSKVEAREFAYSGAADATGQELAVSECAWSRRAFKLKAPMDKSARRRVRKRAENFFMVERARDESLAR